LFEGRVPQQFDGPSSVSIRMPQIGGKHQFQIPCGYLRSHGKWPIEIDGLPIKNEDFP
jgi:hypothetical protein